MRIINTKNNIDICLSENRPIVLIIENPVVLSEILGDLWKQSNGQDGGFIISQKDKIVRVDKTVEVIINPFAITCNDKKILNKIFQDLNAISVDEYDTEILDINKRIVSLLDLLSQKIPFSIIYDLNIDLSALWKMYNVKVDEEETDIIERMIQYIRLLHQTNGYEVFIFVNLKQYMTLEQLDLFYRTVQYEQVFLLDIERSDLKELRCGEKYIILDKDRCIINVE